MADQEPDGVVEFLDFLPPFPEGSPRRVLNDTVRELIAELVTSTADDAVLLRAEGLVREAVALLSSAPHGRDYSSVAEGSLAEHHTQFAYFSPFTGAVNPLAPPMTIARHADRVVAEGTFGPQYEGPPGCLHGGYIAAVFDEVLGFTQSLTGHAGMTGRLEITYRSPTPLYVPLVVEGRVTSVEGRKILTQATLHAGERLCAEATGLFITLKDDGFATLMRERRAKTPDED
jgi:acyl-coenzyme A thioesterase PaaI-like protein